MLNSCNCQGCFGSLGIDSRYKIYETLKTNGSKSVTEISKVLGLKQPTITYHLKQMEENGLLKSSKKGHFVFYEINKTCPQTLKNCILVTTAKSRKA
ncbi:ArsR family transcriptional regulator [bacterium]|jgi:predicted transcriptional regulator|nr:ArsR family transcriptional regulator [bacterium]